MTNNQPAPDTVARLPQAARHDPYAVLRNRDVVLYLVSRFVASLGQQMLTLAVGWELYERTHSTLALALVGLTQMVPMVLFTLPAGHVADNHERKRIIVLMTLAIGGRQPGPDADLRVPGARVLDLLLPVRRRHGAHVSVARQLGLPAATWSHAGSSRRRSPGAAAASSSLRCSAPPPAARVIALTHHAAPVYALNAAAGLICLRPDQPRPRPARRRGEGEDDPGSSLVVGFRFVFASASSSGRSRWTCLPSCWAAPTALLPVYAKDILRAGPSGLGLLQAALPAGSLLCALFLAHRPPLQKAGRTMLWAVAGFGLATIGFGLSHWFWLSFAMLFLCGAMDNVSVVVRHTLVQLLTPDEKRGRVSAVNSLFIGTSNELGGFESGFVAYLFGPVFSVVSGGVGTILVVLAVAAIWPEIRKYGRLDAA